MKKKLVFFCCCIMQVLILHINSFAQSPVPCGNKAPDDSWEQWFSSKVAERRLNIAQNRMSQTNYMIPVIFHIIHNQSTVGTAENLSAAKIAEQLAILNDDFYGNTAIAEGIPPEFQSVAAGNTGIQFCLATCDPNGVALSEPGIDRINWQQQGWNDPANYGDVAIKQYFNQFIKRLTTWDKTKYLNVWITDMGFPDFNYADFPLGNVATINFSPDGYETNLYSGVVLYYKKIGITNNLFYDGGHTITHEIGHWLGLRHIWGDIQCGTDYCDDTPTQKEHHGFANLYFACPSGHLNPNGCGGSTGSAGEMYMNYMDYTKDDCRYLFTQGQTERMQTAMANGIYRAPLAYSPACGSPKSDLIIINQDITPLSVNAGDDVTLSFIERNKGGATAGSNFVNFHLSSNDVLTPGQNGDIYLGQYQVTQSLSSQSQTAVLNKQLTIPLTVTPGVYYLFLAADGSGVVNEYTEDNNFATVRITVTGSSSNGTDLIISDIGSSSSTVQQGGSVYINFREKNIGQISSIANHVNFYLSSDAVLNTTTDISLGEYYINQSLASQQETQIFYKNITIPAATTAGNYHLFLMADGRNTIQEDIEDNNYSSITINVIGQIIQPQPAKLVRYEYWFDDDNTNRITIETTPEKILSLNSSIPVNSLSVGVHSLHIRFMDNYYQWSSVLSSLFYKGLEDNNTINNITNYEYWFDDNYASKTVVSISAQKILNLNTGLNTAGLGTGVHVLNIRFKDSGNQWSSVLSSLFYKGLEDNNAVNNITDYEYWFDSNYASKVSTIVTPQKILNLNTGLSISSLQQGVHVLNIRFKDSGKQWSSILSQMFYKNGSSSVVVNKVLAYRYWYDRNTSNIITVVLPTPVNPYELIANFDVSTLSSGQHTIHFQFKDLIDSWSSVTNDTFNVVAPVKANFIANDTTLCYRGTVAFTNQSTGAVSYLWKFGDGDSSTTANPSHAYNTPGFYTVTLVATNNQGVKDTLRKVNYIIVTVPNVGVSPNVSICIGTSTQLVATGAITYVWSPATGLNTTTGSTVTATPGSNTTYRVIGTDQYGCIDTAFVTVNVSSVLQVGLSASQTTICQGDTVTLMASGANSYTWSPSVGLNSTMGSTVRAFPSVTTTYSVVGTSTCGSDTERVTITVKPKPNTSAGRDTSICAGKSVLLTATGATTYVWNNGINTAANTVTPPSTTSYIVTGTTNGCSSSDTVNVTVRPLPSVNLPDVNICPGGSYTFDAGNPGSSYLWQNNTTSQQLTANTAGLYWVQVTNTFGCVKRDSAIVSLSPSLTINLRDTAVCQGQTVTLNAGNPGATYLWSNGSQTQSISVNQGGSYSILVTGSGGCTGRDTAIVTVKPLPSTDAGRDTAICAGKSVLLTATGATTYAWGNGINTAANTVTPASNTSYIVIGTTNGCSSSDTVNVTVRSSPSVNLPDVNICPGGSYTFDAGNPGSSYLWQNNTTSQQLTANSAGLYWVQVTNSFGCIKRDSAILTLNSNLTIGLRDTSICTGQSVTLNAGNPGATYLWNTGAGTQTITVTQSNTYSVLVTANGGCFKRDTAVVTILPLPTVTLSLADTVSLNTPPFSLTGGLPTGGSYSGAGVAGGIFNPSVAGPGNHVITYTYTDVNGCSNLKKDSIFVQIVTGIKDNKNDLYISLYPNPSNGIIKFSVNNVKDENGDIEVLNNLGQILYSDKIKIINSSEFTFDISNFASGVYYLKIRINDQFRTYPIEVVK